MDLKNKISRLPDCYDKRNTSNNWKILEMVRSAKEDIAKDLESIRSASDIESAEGAALGCFRAGVQSTARAHERCCIPHADFTGKSA